MQQQELSFSVSSKLRVALAMTLGLIGFCLGALALPAARLHATSQNEVLKDGYRAASVRPAKIILRRGMPPRPASTNLNDPPTLQLTAITCLSSADCWAVGYRLSSIARTFTEHWDGAEWKPIPSPNTSSEDHNFLNAITCTSSTNCWVVGGYNTGSQIHTLLEHWDGNAWAIVPSPNTSPTEYNELMGISCASVSDCWAVGHANNQTLVQHWNGNVWAIVTSPNGATADSNQLAGVTCLSGTDCWAAGSYHTGGFSSNRYRTLIEHWNGTAWTIVNSPNPDIAQNELRSIACTSGTNCWAAGYFNDSNGFAALFEKWDGNAWTMAEPGSLADGDDAFAVACSSANDCWTTGKDGDELTMIQHWDGVRWNKIVEPDLGHNVGWTNLTGVTCNSATDCWAAGNLNSSGLIEHWNGTSWKVYPIPPLVRIDSETHTSAGTIAIDGVGPALSVIDIEAGSDLNADFETFTTVTADADGVFHVEDTTAVPTRFYWAIWR